MSEFNKENNQASDTVPIQAGILKKGSYAILKGYPCKITEISTSKTGKHGHAKASITGIDIFTGKKYQDISPTSHNVMQPIINKKDYQLIEITEDNFVCLMDQEGNIREDLSIDIYNDDNHKKMKTDFELGKNIVVTVMKCMQKEKIVACKEALN